jgi:hypothetical protein
MRICLLLFKYTKLENHLRKKLEPLQPFLQLGPFSNQLEMLLAGGVDLKPPDSFANLKPANTRGVAGQAKVDFKKGDWYPEGSFL